MSLPMDAPNASDAQEVDARPYILQPVLHEPPAGEAWWRRAVIYQIYPRSFKDSTGSGMGDLAGITAELPKIATLGVDAIWLSPFFPSPQKDAGYDVSDYRGVDPLFGTMEDAKTLIRTAKSFGIRIIIDIVPNHCSNEHALFQAALAAAPGSAERAMFHFADGLGEGGNIPPNNWFSLFGGSGWTRVPNPDGTPGQYYFHLFDATQPDFNWRNPAVQEEFEKTLRFWLDAGAGGFRIDVAHAMFKKDGMPDWGGAPDGTPREGFPFADAPMFGQPELHQVFARWREICDQYPGEPVLCSEANVRPLTRLADWVAPGQMHQSFNFDYLRTLWDRDALATVIADSLAAFDTVGAPTTWVLSNHDVSRHATRFGLDHVALDLGDGIGPRDPQPDTVLGLARARAATLFMLGLPGGAYLYQGEELGLGDHTTLADEYRQDPGFLRTNGAKTGRDGCRVPLPWVHDAPAYGFSPTGDTWLPQPGDWAAFSRDVQEEDPASTLNLYRKALALRSELGLGLGSLAFYANPQLPEVLAIRNGDTVNVLNLSGAPVPLPQGEPLLFSAADGPALAAKGLLGANAAAWLRSADA
ncbi:glycoside hydrolase family 13 protein [Paeniglutamicibacter sp. MACA_103]|uniref:glycoside hydrolase family 13 protein n=1 Tax=Paeniglutamicibacter sp. MACA_103 TaxID=3377337 RepID=UPI003894DF67